MIKQIFLGLLLGLILSIANLQYDPYVQKIIGDGFKMAFEQALDCKLDCTIEYINLFSPTIALRDVTVTPSSNGRGWQWQAKKYVTQFSWLHLLLQGTIDIRVHMKDLIAETDFENGALAMLPHMQKMAIGDPNVPMLLTGINLEKATFIINDRIKKQKVTITWRSNTQRMGQLVRSDLTLLDGEFAQESIPYLRHLNGTLSCDIVETNGLPQLSIRSTCNATVDNIFKQPLMCTLAVQWDDVKKACSLSTNNHELAIDQIQIAMANQNFEVQVQGKFPLEFASDIGRLFAYQIPVMQGSADFNMNIICDALIPHGKGTVTIKEMRTNSYTLAHEVLCNFCHKDTLLSGTIQAKHDAIGSIAGEWRYDLFKKNGSFKMHNDLPLAITHLKDWHISADDCAVALDIDAHGKVNGKYRIHAMHNDSKHSLIGEIQADNEKIKMGGALDDKKYMAQMHLAPQLRLDEIHITDADNSNLASFYADDQYKYGINGHVNLEKLKPFLLPVDFEIGTLGKLLCKAHASDTGIIHAECVLKNAALRIQRTYNCVTNIDATFDTDVFAKKITLNKADIQLQKGSISCDNAVLAMNEKNEIAHMYLPLLFDNCFIPLQKDINATFSGNLLIHHQLNELPSINGHLFIDNALIKHNVVSIDFIKMVTALALHDAGKSFNIPIDAVCDITVDTKAPIHIATHIIEADAHVSLHLYNSVKDPLLTGSINILNGVVYLPYKPLFIQKGSVTFMPGHLDNPHIEFLAHNTIKKHDINVNANGTLKDYTFWMSSNPSLNENQIAALLLVGSPDASISTIVPAVATQTLKNIIFQSNPYIMASNNTFKKLIKPLRTVHLVPVFDNQTARGGIRAAFEIEIGQRVKALIQKNFTLTEDTRFELEYLLSDDISVRGIRDERRDVNAEVEMRWKF